MDYTIYYVSIPVIVAVIVIGWIIAHRKPPPPPEILARGWQFYSYPTSGEPPGTIFRITQDKQRYIVTIPQTVISHPTAEAMGKITQKTEASMGTLAKLLGLEIKVGAEQKQELKFEMESPINETTYDAEIDRVIQEELGKEQLKKDNRYFVIRETKKTKKIDYELTKNLVDSLGGEAKIAEKIDVKTTVFSRKDDLNFELKQEFDEPMRIMFHPEEIHKEEQEITFGGLGGPVGEAPKYTRKAVEESLEWTDAK